MRGKLHLIDLAGSERLSKTGAQVRQGVGGAGQAECRGTGARAVLRG